MMGGNMKGGWFRGYAIVYLLVLYAPIMLLPIFAFNDSKIIAFPLSGFTTHWFAEMWSDSQLFNALKNSLIISGTTAILATTLGIFAARATTRFSFPAKVQSLRSGLSGWQYYDIALELVDVAGVRKKIMHLDFVYSSTCPCSLELSEHARRTRGQLATPHSQRSVARISVVVKPGDRLWFEDLIEIARSAVPTETQVMVKREDEQAFAELNAANPIFVEDAARVFCQALKSDPRIGDFRIVASHQESLHSHDAVSVLTEGPTFAADSLDPKLFASLYHVG